MPISTAQLLHDDPPEPVRRFLWHVLSLGAVSRDEPERHESFDKPGMFLSGVEEGAGRLVLGKNAGANAHAAFPRGAGRRRVVAEGHRARFRILAGSVAPARLRRHDGAGILKRGPQTLQRKPSEYLRDICREIVPPLPEARRSAMDFTSADKLLFSSGHPWVEPAVMLGARRSLNLPAADAQKILRGNARQLFRL